MNQMQQMLMRAQKMQRELEKQQAALAEKEFAASKAGMVDVVVLGNKTIKSIDIDKDALDPENKEMLEESIMMALNEAMEAAHKEADEIQEKVTGQTQLF